MIGQPAIEQSIQARGRREIERLDPYLADDYAARAEAAKLGKECRKVQRYLVSTLRPTAPVRCKTSSLFYTPSHP